MPLGGDHNGDGFGQIPARRRGDHTVAGARQRHTGLANGGDVAAVVLAVPAVAQDRERHPAGTHASSVGRCMAAVDSAVSSALRPLV